MDRGSLAGLRKLGRIPPHILAAMALHVLSGLDYLHAKQLLHNDIKPANVLLSAEGLVKLTDFGITRFMKDSVCRTVMGTKTYLAPEKVVPEDGYSLPSDIWSFGVMMFELASGSHPFAGADDSFAAIFKCLIDDPEPRLSEEQGYPPSLCHFIERCLVRDPSRRATANELLVHEFLDMAASQHELSEWLESRT